MSRATYEERTRRGTPRHGDLLYSREGTYFGIAAEVPQHGDPVCLGQRMVLLRPNEDRVNPRYLRLFLNSALMQRHLRGFHDGSVAQRLNVGTIRALPVAIPPPKTQDAIAGFLGAIDDKIELNREMNRTLEDMAQAIFRSWFVDFDPVVAKADGREPFGMDAETAALFPDRFVDSELGPIPEGWEVRPLPEAIDLNPRRSLAKGQDATYLGMSDMPTRGAIPVVWGRRSFGSGTKFMNGDTLLARITPCLENGKTAFVSFLADGEVAWGSTEYVVFRPRQPLTPEFGYFLARSPELRAFAISRLTGSSGRQRVQTSAWENFLFPWPSPDVSSAFGHVVEPITQLMLANIRESQTLAALRDLLLPKLLSGEIRVPEAEELVEDIA